MNLIDKESINSYFFTNMAVADLTNEPQEVITGNDNIVIVDNLQSIRGGHTLDTAGFKPEAINAGHVIIRETATGEYKPLGIIPAGTDIGTTQSPNITTEDTYAALPGCELLSKICIFVTANISFLSSRSRQRVVNCFQKFVSL